MVELAMPPVHLSQRHTTTNEAPLTSLELERPAMRSGTALETWSNGPLSPVADAPKPSSVLCERLFP
jgi:hypothetical protein